MDSYINFLTYTPIKTITSEELNCGLEIDFGIVDQEDIYNEIIYKNQKTNHIPINIDTVIKYLEELKACGSTHVEIDYHCDHVEYEFHGSKIEQSTLEEIIHEDFLSHEKNKAIENIKLLEESIFLTKKKYNELIKTY